MALEIANVVHAIGCFVGSAVVPPPFVSVPPVATDRMVSANGIAAFTHNGVGDYTAQLSEPVGGGESVVHLGLPENVKGSYGAQVVVTAPVAPSVTNGAAVAIKTFDAFGNPADVPFFYLTVFKVPSDRPSLAIPVAVSALGQGLPFSAAVMVLATVDKVLKPGIINQVDASGGAFAALLPDTTVVGAVPTNTVIVIKSVAAPTDGLLTITAVGGSNLELPTTGALAASFTPAAEEGLYLAYQYDGTNWRVVGYSLH
jgi:hypothetical protein